ncbi:hypothetical protein [Nocardia sp. BMG111209]|uniref:hypothetical protein n=1 Tax=Nocardia sp. BMG111209 TaxID=1160137 RepID=UPI0012DF5CB1|nr:hypothetical protein [Nocardia sp. BMG111209]
MAGYAACSFAMADTGGGEHHAETDSAAAQFDSTRRGRGPGGRCPLARSGRRTSDGADHVPPPDRRRAERPSEPSLEPLAEPALGIGVVMLLVVLVCAPRIPAWADDYGIVLVYLALFIHLALAVGALRWGLRIRREHRIVPKAPRSGAAAPESDAEPERRDSSIE